MSSPTLKGSTKERSPYADNVTNDPFFTVARPGADIVLAYAERAKVHEFRLLGYKAVDPKDIEVMDYGQYAPASKDIGVYVDVDKKASDHRVGEHILMSAPRARVEARKQAELERSRNFKPRKTDSGESEKAELGEETTVGDEIQL